MTRRAARSLAATLAPHAWATRHSRACQLRPVQRCHLPPLPATRHLHALRHSWPHPPPPPSCAPHPPHCPPRSEPPWCCWQRERAPLGGRTSAILRACARQLAAARQPMGSMRICCALNFLALANQRSRRSKFQFPAGSESSTIRTFLFHTIRSAHHGHPAALHHASRNCCILCRIVLLHSGGAAVRAAARGVWRRLGCCCWRRACVGAQHVGDRGARQLSGALRRCAATPLHVQHQCCVCIRHALGAGCSGAPCNRVLWRATVDPRGQRLGALAVSRHGMERAIATDGYVFVRMCLRVCCLRVCCLRVWCLRVWCLCVCARVPTCVVAHLTPLLRSGNHATAHCAAAPWCTAARGVAALHLCVLRWRVRVHGSPGDWAGGGLAGAPLAVRRGRP